MSGVVLLVAASGVFGELQDALNTIWEVKPKAGRGIKGFIRDRFFSFTMVLGVAFLLLVSLVVSAGLAAVNGMFGDLGGLTIVWQVMNVVIAFGVSTVLFALSRIVPSASAVRVTAESRAQQGLASPTSGRDASAQL